MDWFHFLRPSSAACQIDLLALQVAERCQSAVQARLGLQTSNMKPSEARGYVRARATVVVRRETDVLFSERRELPSRLREELFRQATEQVVALFCEPAGAGQSSRANSQAA